MRDFIGIVILTLFYIIMGFFGLLCIATGILFMVYCFRDGQYLIGVVCLLLGFLISLCFFPFLQDHITAETLGGLVTLVAWLPLGYLGIRCFWSGIVMGFEEGGIENIIMGCLAGTFILVYCTCGVFVAGYGIDTILNALKKLNR